MNTKKTDIETVYFNMATKIDEITLAKDTEFAINVSRYSHHPNIPEAVIFSALIEEIQQLKTRLTNLEKQNEQNPT